MPVLGTVLCLLALVLAAQACRRPSLEGTGVHLDLAARFQWAEAWGPVERLDLGSGGHELQLLDGLYFAEREPDGRTYAWSWGEETSFLLTCPARRNRTLEICCRRLGVEALDDLVVEVVLNDTVLGRFTPGTEYGDHAFAAPVGTWREGDNRLALRYSEDVYLPDVIPGNTDTRRVAVQLDEIRIVTSEDGASVIAVDQGLELPLPADVSWHVRLPGSALLSFGCEAGPDANLRVRVTPEGGAPVELFSRAFRAGEHCDLFTADLDPWAGDFVRLTVSANRTGGQSGRIRLLRPEIRTPLAGSAVRPPVAPVSLGGQLPDVLVYVMDALRASNLSAYGYPRRTSPALDRLSRQGLLFQQAFSQAPNTAPSVKSLFTGRFLPFTGYGALPAEHPTLAEVFSGAGYATGLFSNNPYLGPEPGFYRGFDHVAEEILFRRQPVKDFAGQATNAVIRWADDLKPDRPLFAYVHTIHPHNPYEAPAPFGGLFLGPGEGSADQDLSTETLLAYVYGERVLGERTLERMRDFYDGDILYNDLALARLLSWLRGADRGRETLIVITADHGEELADHGGLLHGYTLYDEQIHVPLILVVPHAEPRVVADTVRLVDLAPTLYELCGFEEAPATEGESLTTWLGNGTGGAERTVYASASSANGLYTVRSGRWKYVFAPRTRHLWGMGQGLGRTRELHYLFDLEIDPGERNNLADSCQITRKALQVGLLEWIDEQARMDDGAADQGEMPDFDEETRQRLLDLGYLAE